MQFFLNYMCSVDDVKDKEVDGESSNSSAYTPTTYIVKNNRIPIFFNFKIADSIVISNGSIDKWYYSDEMGQILIKEGVKLQDWTSLITHEGKQEQS